MADDIFSAIMSANSVIDRLIDGGKLSGTDLARAKSIKSTLTNMKAPAFALREYTVSTPTDDKAA